MNVFDVIRKQANEMMATLQTDVTTGRCSDFAEYRYACGYMLGLNQMISYLDELERNTGEEN